MNRDLINNYISGNDTLPLLINGDCFSELESIPSRSVSLIVTSPPFYKARVIASGPFSSVKTLDDYLSLLSAFGRECYRILSNDGSFWLNLGDAYSKDGSLFEIPSRVAIKYQDDLDFLLRDDIIYEKSVFLPSGTRNRTSLSYEHFFHFVKEKDYYFNGNIVSKKNAFVDSSGRVVSSTGLTGENYASKIKDSLLSENEKSEALKALEREKKKIVFGEISDFRLLLRNSSSSRGRNEETEKKGFAFIESHGGERLGSVWTIRPSRHSIHDSPFPEELIAYPILSNSRKGSLVVDPFAGSGTALDFAYRNKRKSLGFEIEERYWAEAKKRWGE